MGSLVDSQSQANGAQPGESLSSVILIPWDPDSPEQVERMRQQRIACGWKVEKVYSWGELQRHGKIGLHWIQKHFAAFPDEAATLQDTCLSIFGRARIPNPEYTSFHPIGHISLDAWAPDETLGTSPAAGVYSITTFYVSKALQSSGIGNIALRSCEQMAAKDFGAKAITLDTVAKEETLPDNPRVIAMKLDYKGFSNQDWYERRGYESYARRKDAYFDTDSTGKKWGLTAVYFRKDLHVVKNGFPDSSDFFMES